MRKEVGTQEKEVWMDAKSICREGKHEHRPTRKEQDLMQRAIEKPIRGSRTAPQNATNVSAGLFLLFAEAARAEEDAAMDAEDTLTQAEEANALDPVG